MSFGRGARVLLLSFVWWEIEWSYWSTQTSGDSTKESFCILFFENVVHFGDKFKNTLLATGIKGMIYDMTAARRWGVSGIELRVTWKLGKLLTDCLLRPLLLFVLLLGTEIDGRYIGLVVNCRRIGICVVVVVVLAILN